MERLGPLRDAPQRLGSLIVCSTCTPLAQINPGSSRPTAVTILCLVFPLEQLGKEAVQALTAALACFCRAASLAQCCAGTDTTRPAGGATAGLLGGAARLRVC